MRLAPYHSGGPGFGPRAVHKIIEFGSTVVRRRFMLLKKKKKKKKKNLKTCRTNFYFKSERDEKQIEVMTPISRLDSFIFK